MFGYSGSEELVFGVNFLIHFTVISILAVFISWILKAIIKQEDLRPCHVILSSLQSGVTRQERPILTKPVSGIGRKKSVRKIYPRAATQDVGLFSLTAELWASVVYYNSIS